MSFTYRRNLTTFFFLNQLQVLHFLLMDKI
nr:MAG TPA: hypothetical protein [Bacteriophage sp.]